MDRWAAGPRARARVGFGRRPLLVGLAAGVLVAVGAGVAAWSLTRTGRDMPGAASNHSAATSPAVLAPAGQTMGPVSGPVVPPSTQTSADPHDPVALAREAVDNVRLMERFRFAETIRGVGNGTYEGGSRVLGEVDLSTGPDDPPRVLTTQSLHRPNSQPVEFQQVTIGTKVFAKLPGADAFTQLSTQPAHARGQAAGPTGGGQTALVVDPVMLLLDPVDELPARAFVRSGKSGTAWTVWVRLPGQGQGPRVFSISIDGATHLVREIRFSLPKGSAVIRLMGFGDPSIQIPFPVS